MNAIAANELGVDETTQSEPTRWSPADDLLVWTVSRINGGRRHGVEPDCHVVYALTPTHFVEQTRRYRASAQKCIDLLLSGKSAGRTQRKIELNTVMALHSNPESGRLSIRTLNGTHYLEPVNSEEASILREIAGEIDVRIPPGGARFLGTIAFGDEPRTYSAEEDRRAAVAVDHARAEDESDTTKPPRYELPIAPVALPPHVRDYPEPTQPVEAPGSHAVPVSPYAAEPMHDPVSPYAAEPMQAVPASQAGESPYAVSPGSEWVYEESPYVAAPTVESASAEASAVSMAGSRPAPQAVDARLTPQSVSEYSQSAYTAPSDTAPAYTVPNDTAPAYTAPAYTAPNDTAPNDTAPNRSGSDVPSDITVTGGVAITFQPATGEAPAAAPRHTPDAATIARIQESPYIAKQAPTTEWQASLAGGSGAAGFAAPSQPTEASVSPDPSITVGSTFTPEPTTPAAVPSAQAQPAEAIERRQVADPAFPASFDRREEQPFRQQMAEGPADPAPYTAPVEQPPAVFAGGGDQAITASEMYTEQPNTRVATPPATQASASAEPGPGANSRNEDSPYPSVFDRRSLRTATEEVPGWIAPDAEPSDQEATAEEPVMPTGPPVIGPPVAGSSGPSTISGGGAIGFNPDFDVNPFR